MAENSNSKIEYYKIYYSNNINIYKEFYLLNGLLHRIDGPAEIYYYRNGNICSEAYWLNDNYHRVDGPAIIYYHINGNIEAEFYYLNDEEVNVTNDKEFIRWQKAQILK